MFYTSGGSDNKPVVWSLPGIGYVDNTLPLYLSVDVWPTNYALGSEQWASVTVNGVSLMDYCSPNDECGNDWFNCLQNVDISDLISEQNGGHIVVEVSSVGVNSGPCDKNGYSLYTRMVLQEALPRKEQLSIWAIIGAILGGLLILIVVLWLLYVKYFRTRYAAVYGPEDISARRQSDVESCVENEDDAIDDIFKVFEPPVTVRPVVVHKNIANLAKVVPIETDLEMQDVESEANPTPVAEVKDVVEEEEDRVQQEIPPVDLISKPKKKKLFAAYSMELDPEDQKLEDDREDVKQRLADSSSSGVNMARRPPPQAPLPSVYNELQAPSTTNSNVQNDFTADYLSD
jgi:hypothetical protein